MPAYNRAELNVELTILPSAQGAKPPREQVEAGMRAASDCGLSALEAGPETTAVSGRRAEVLDAMRKVIEASLDAGAEGVRIKVEAQEEAGKFGRAGGRRGSA